MNLFNNSMGLLERSIYTIRSMLHTSAINDLNYSLPFSSRCYLRQHIITDIVFNLGGLIK